MNFSGPGLSYIFLVIPTLFSLAVVGQGIYKMSRNEPDGSVALGFGVVCLVLVGAAYWLFIR
ncbi:hypothetical protein HY031_01155 [Candidatus Gottesmanbacteria bacterium]|nr:hypothetical protein [Candidatus Gottesmanbacteria bacterium]